MYSDILTYEIMTLMTLIRGMDTLQKYIMRAATYILKGIQNTFCTGKFKFVSNRCKRFSGVFALPSASVNNRYEAEVCTT